MEVSLEALAIESQSKQEKRLAAKRRLEGCHTRLDQQRHRGGKNSQSDTRTQSMKVSQRQADEGYPGALRYAVLLSELLRPDLSMMAVALVV